MNTLTKQRISALRNHPVRSIINYDFFVEINGIQNIIHPITITGNSHTEDTVTYLEISADNQNTSCDFYFPYIPAQAGNVIIPNNILSEGTLVTTTGMNGCTLEVRYKDGCYTFYHDANGRHMPPLNPTEVRVCRIEGDDYWNYDAARSAVETGKTPIVQFICIFRHGFWHIGAFGLYIVGGDFMRKIVTDTYIPKRGKYRGYFNENIHETL